MSFRVDVWLAGNSMFQSLPSPQKSETKTPWTLHLSNDPSSFKFAGKVSFKVRFLSYNKSHQPWRQVLPGSCRLITRMSSGGLHSGDLDSRLWCAQSLAGLGLHSSIDSMTTMNQPDHHALLVVHLTEKLEITLWWTSFFARALSTAIGYCISRTDSSLTLIIINNSWYKYRQPSVPIAQTLRFNCQQSIYINHISIY